MKTLFFALMFLSSVLYGQDKSYKAKHLYHHTTDGEHTPLGKDVTVTFDSFFQQYKLIFTNEKGNKSTIVFKKEGSKNFDVKNDELAWTEIVDEISTKKRMTIKNGDYASYILEGITIVKK